MASLTVPLPPRLGIVTAAGHQAAVDAAVELLRSSKSLWPVDTGRSKRAWRRLGSGWNSQIFNPLRYASFVEALNGRPARKTLDRNRSILRRAARRALVIAPVGTRSDILDAFAARAVLEEQAELYSVYAALRAAQGRVPRIPAAVRALDRQLRRAATR
ncbi:MAG: hypothetical protein OXG72_09015 [Acidobacteria bacterium]|nr:hypothetical protein [Acidobacteriota bacterium]